MAALCHSDPGFSDYDIAYFEYPTSLIRLPFTRRSNSLTELSAGLRAELALTHSDADDITVIAHSLGGIVARQYIIEEFRRGNTLPFNRLLLYAVPHSGAQLASIGRHVSWRHSHLNQIALDSDVLEHLNEDWEYLEIEKRLPTIHAVGGQDRVVARRSTMPFYGRSNVYTLIQNSHGSIISPKDHNDLSYVILRRFITNATGTVSTSRTPDAQSEHPSRPADPLFDIYTLKEEIYYFFRQDDKAVDIALSRGHVWISGASGTGKTTALRRCVLASSRRLRQISLGSYNVSSATAIVRALCIEAGSINGNSTVPANEADFGTLNLLLRSELRQMCNDRVTVLVVEEIPIRSEQIYREFMKMILSVISSLDADETISSRLLLAFSSIESPITSIGSQASKLKDRVSFIQLTSWNSRDIEGLLELLGPAMHFPIGEHDRNAIVKASGGLPRFVKMVLRQKRNGQSDALSIRDIVEQVAGDLV